jgi:hypothetical protein
LCAWIVCMDEMSRQLLKHVREPIGLSLRGRFWGRGI